MTGAEPEAAPQSTFGLNTTRDAADPFNGPARLAIMMMLGNSERAGLVHFLRGRPDHYGGLRPGPPTTTLRYAPIGMRDLGRASTVASQTLISEPLRGAGGLLDPTVPHYSQAKPSLTAACHLPSSRAAPPFRCSSFAALSGGLMVTDHAASDGTSYAMMHEMAGKTTDDSAFDAALGMTARGDRIVNATTNAFAHTATIPIHRPASPRRDRRGVDQSSAFASFGLQPLNRSGRQRGAKRNPTEVASQGPAHVSRAIGCETCEATARCRQLYV
jgi:hypothetical protein